MDSTRNQKIAEALDRLFRTYQQSDRGEAGLVVSERIERAKVYFEAVAPYELRDIETAIGNFITGSAPGNNAAFVPPAPAVGAECRRVMNLRVDSEARSRVYKPALPPPDHVVSPEARARAKALVAKAVAHLTGVEEAERIPGREALTDLMHRVDASMGADMSPEAMAHRLGYSVGNEDGEGEAA